MVGVDAPGTRSAPPQLKPRLSARSAPLTQTIGASDLTCRGRRASDAPVGGPTVPKATWVLTGDPEMPPTPAERGGGGFEPFGAVTRDGRARELRGSSSRREDRRKVHAGRVMPIERRSMARSRGRFCSGVPGTGEPVDEGSARAKNRWKGGLAVKSRSGDEGGARREGIARRGLCRLRRAREREKV